MSWTSITSKIFKIDGRCGGDWRHLPTVEKKRSKHTKSARNTNKTQGDTSQDVSKRWEESNVSVPKLMLRRGLKETIVAVD